MDYLYAVLGYLMGSIPFGIFMAKIAKAGDIRAQGSGNIGATNLARVAGKKWGALTLLLDAAKGVIPVLIAPSHMVLLTGLMAIIGHCFPIWLKGKGGKGVATSLGVVTAIYWPLGLFALATWVIVFIITKISSLSALASFVALPIFGFFWAGYAPVGTLYFCLVVSALVLVRHKENMKRLRNKQEGKIT